MVKTLQEYWQSMRNRFTLKLCRGGGEIKNYVNNYKTDDRRPRLSGDKINVMSTDDKRATRRRSTRRHSSYVIIMVGIRIYDTILYTVKPLFNENLTVLRDENSLKE